MSVEPYRGAIEEASRATRASDEAVQRVQQRLAADPQVQGYDPRALRGVPDPASGAAERVAAPERGLVALDGMAVGEDLGAVAV